MFEARVAELETLAREQGLNFFPMSLHWHTNNSA
jgi:hypothetical protein